LERRTHIRAQDARESVESKIAYIPDELPYKKREL